MMGSKRFLFCYLVQYLWILCVHTVECKQAPNIILIVSDDLGWNDVSFHGSNQIPTPNLDSLANHGIILGNYYVQPICTPTRSALMTGRHPIHLGLQHSVLFGSSPYGLGLNETIMPQYLKPLGYATHMVGKWHLGMHAKEFTPTYRGFDSHFGYYQGCEDYYDHTYDPGGKQSPLEWGLDFRRNMDVVKDKFGKYSTEVFAEEAENIIDNHDTSQPLFLYLPFQAVHSGNPVTPLDAPWKYRERFGYIKDPNRRMFAAMVSAMDDAIGNIFSRLSSKGMLENSVILFTTDNGGPAAGFDMNHASNWPLRGVKATQWEGGMRGSGFVWSPLLKKSGYTSDHMMHVCDILPTFLNAAGYDMSKLPANLDGVDLWDSLSLNKDSPRTEILHNIDPTDNYMSIRMGDMKLIKGSNPYGRKWDGWYPAESVDSHHQPIRNTKRGLGYEFNSTIEDIVKTLTPKINTKAPFQIVCNSKPPNENEICYPDNQAPCLFNITADPCEFTNLAAKFPDYVNKLSQRLDYYNTTAVPILNCPQDPKGFPKYHNWIWTPWINLTAEEVKDMMSPSGGRK